MLPTLTAGTITETHPNALTPARTPTYAAALSLLTATLLLPAQTATQTAQQPAAASPTPTTAPPPHPSSNRNNNLVLDAAHGGADDGARIGDGLLEKDLTLALVGRIRAQLAGQENLNLTLTRDPDAGDPALDTQPPAPSIDSRAGVANHAHAFACILLHATAAGSGVHIVTSELPPPDPSTPVTSATPWSTAQATYVRQSLRLANQVGLSLLHAGIPVYLTHASVRPLDSLTCPAIAIEVAPPRAAPSDPSRIDDPSYQQRISTAVASALVAWRNRPVTPPSVTAPVASPDAKPASTPAPSPTSPSAPPASAAPVIVHPRKPASAVPTPTQPPAPIIRRPPPPAPEPQPTSPPPTGGGARP